MRALVSAAVVGLGTTWRILLRGSRGGIYCFGFLGSGFKFARMMASRNSPWVMACFLTSGIGARGPTGTTLEPAAAQWALSASFFLWAISDRRASARAAWATSCWKSSARLIFSFSFAFSLSFSLLSEALDLEEVGGAIFGIGGSDGGLGIKLRIGAYIELSN